MQQKQISFILAGGKLCHKKKKKKRTVVIEMLWFKQLLYNDNVKIFK